MKSWAVAMMDHDRACPKVEFHLVRSGTPPPPLFAAAKPARQASLGLGGGVFHLAIEFVDSLDRVGLGVLCVRFDVALCYRVLLVRLGCLNAEKTASM